MGCLLGCLGIASRRRGRKLPTRILPRDHGLGSYEQLHSSGSADFVSTTLDSEQRKLKETLNSKIRKKVRFNLNVEAYEPIPSDSFYQGTETAFTVMTKRKKTRKTCMMIIVIWTRMKTCTTRKKQRMINTTILKS
ncbi:hypothetical protein LINPERHAP2_LOCUS14391 [Linum perenne]